jgi:hypothetical protein
MRRILTLCLTFHWTVAFSLLSFFTIQAVGPDGALSAEILAVPLIGGIAPALLAVMLLLASALFLWAFLTVLTDRDELAAASEHTARVAFAAAIALMTLVMAVLALVPALDRLIVAAVYFAALLLSYVVIAVENGASARTPTPTQARNLRPLDRRPDIRRALPNRPSAIVYTFPGKEPR